MSTPIEIVRTLIDGTRDSALSAALAAVLRDAERYMALERAHDSLKAGGYAMCDHDAATDEWYVRSEPLAALADRLKGTQ